MGGKTFPQNHVVSGKAKKGKKEGMEREGRKDHEGQEAREG